MNTPFDFKPSEDNRLVYIRPVDVAELPDEVKAEAMGREQVYAVHAPNGDRLALVKDRELAFVIARQNEFAPVSVH